MGSAAPLFVAVTADVDPDSNRPAPGRADAVSPGGEATFDATLEGLRLLRDALEERALPATLFWEGRTLQEVAARDPRLIDSLRRNRAFEHGCHGHVHEDFAGRQSGRPLDVEQTREALRKGERCLWERMGRGPEGFRAPYCRLTAPLVQVLQERDYTYDASLPRRAGDRWGLTPWPLGRGSVLELGLCRAADSRGRPISGYLWQMLEGNRPPEDYLALAEGLREECRGGLLQIALHPWHLRVRAGGAPADQENPRRLTELLDRMRVLEGLYFTTNSAYLARLDRTTASSPQRT